MAFAESSSVTIGKAVGQFAVAANHSDTIYKPECGDNTYDIFFGSFVVVAVSKFKTISVQVYSLVTITGEVSHS